MRSKIKTIAFVLTVITSVGVAPQVVAQGKPRVVAPGKLAASVQTKISAPTPGKNLAPSGKPAAVAIEKQGENAVEKAFIITQTHYFLGRWQIFVNGDKVKAINLGEGYGIVTMAPTWKVVFFRDNGGAKMYEMTMKSFLLTGIPLSSGYVIEGKIREAKQSRAQYKGLRTLQYTFQRGGGTGEKPAWTLADVPKEAAVCLSRYWVCRLLSRDDTVCNFVQKLFMVPATVGYPVAFIDTRTDNTSNAVLDTISCKGRPPAEIEITYPTSTKYKLCKGLRDVTLSTAKRDSFNEWAETIGKD